MQKSGGKGLDNERNNELELEAEEVIARQDGAAETAVEETESETQIGEQSAEETENEKIEDETQETEEADGEEESVQEAEIIDEDELCASCGVYRKAEGSDYCEMCEERLKSTKIPFLGWISGIAAVAAGVFALAIAFLVSAPALQVYKGDLKAAENCWYPAYEAYGQVDSLVSSVNDILGQESPFVKAGVGVKMKIFESVAHCYSPLEAAYSADSIFSGTNFDFTSKSRKVKQYKQILTDYQNTYELVADPVAALQEEEATIEETVAAFEKARSEEGVNEVFLDYLLYNVAAYMDLSDEEKLKYLEAVEAADEKDKTDYSWLYSLDIARLRNALGQTEKALDNLNRQLEFDSSSYDAAAMKMRILLSLGKKDEAGMVMQEYKSACTDTDMAYQLEIAYLRSTGELSKARELCTEAFEVYATSPEIYRQSALIYLAEGDYDEAYETAYEADYIAYQIYSYSGDSSAYTQELNNTVYLCAWLCREKGNKDTDNAAYLDDIIDSFSDAELSESVIQIREGKITLEEVLLKGECDLV